jgi:hypothetical protein
MAKYDHGGGCPCGLYAQCDPDCKMYKAPEKIWITTDTVTGLVTTSMEAATQYSTLDPVVESVTASPVSETKPTNPKDAIGCDKLPLHLWPTTASVLGALGLLDGALKYGRANWRATGVRASIYYDAARRHLDKWFEGEDCDPVEDENGNAVGSGLPHLAHALACLAIIVDAQSAGKLNDDRMYAGNGFRELLKDMTPHVKRLKALHAGKNPHHYTIADTSPTSQ